ncbi:PCMD domain-containing protein [Bacteroides mediterraneensis]|uniref:PCMD domain-containing protein n=1 Tax=Bacteroides mediterraneensis TaxID=1841856 RepID=A0ABS2ET78_9BACE|nr:PCMD domain-containing protein [Bacteroides mediterraneensis]MBM6757867.1 PCMD domain-containing protein [Bacteroides mediterraneensis]MBM6779943.1 PCMD domain-containing protein [Bacteroides mediterraneensis]
MKLYRIIGMCLLGMPLVMHAQEKVVPIKYGDMDQWVTRKIHESGIIGGNTKLLYELGPTKEIDGNVAYVNQGGSPWGNSNVMAKVMGIVKTNTSVYPEKRGNGYCARLETHIESVKVLGLVNITVLASGSMFLGDMKEPITSTKDGEKALNSGLPFTSRPKAIRYDYKVQMSGEPNRIRQTGFSKKATIPGQDCAIMVCLLQKRTEDAEGNIIAKRVGTVAVKYNKTQGWHNGATYEIMYGDITHDKRYVADLMQLGTGGYYARNSKGESKLIKEVGWAGENEHPTHLILQFTSSMGGAFIGSPGNKLWIDNVNLVY